MPLQWFQAYLSARKQFVSVNGHLPDELEIKHGVPLGSLGSYHFLAHGGGGGGGGCGRNGMKDSVKFLIPPGSSRKIVDPSSLFVEISCDPPQTTTTKSLLGL